MYHLVTYVSLHASQETFTIEICSLKLGMILLLTPVLIRASLVSWTSV